MKGDFYVPKIIFIRQQEKLRGLNVKCSQKLLVERTQHVTRRQRGWGRVKGRRRVGRGFWSLPRSDPKTKGYWPRSDPKTKGYWQQEEKLGKCPKQ